jgi:raffinose/stachyose/melibiose transport system permease protein
MAGTGDGSAAGTDGAVRPDRARVVARRGRRASDAPLWLVYGLLLGPVGFLVVFNYVPAASAVYHAFTAWDIGTESRWVGLANFRELARDPVFLKGLVNLSKLGAFAFITGLTIPFLVAELIFHIKSDRWNYLCRVLVVLPMMVPGVVVYMLWKHIYGDAGIPTEILTNLGLHDWVYGWLSHPRTALWAVAFVGFPFVHGFTVLVYYAGLANIPTSALEAAELDGLGPVGRVFRIHIPLILQQVKLLVVLTVINVVNGFESVYILTLDGGPGYETMVPGLYMYLNGFNFQRMGYACAIGLLMLAFLLLFTVSLNRLMRVDQYEPGE